MTSDCKKSSNKHLKYMRNHLNRKIAKVKVGLTKIRIRRSINKSSNMERI